MTQEHESNQLAHARLVVRSIASPRRFMTTSAVVRDVTKPWLRSGRAKAIIESSEGEARAITEACYKLLRSLSLAHTLLEIESPALQEYSELRRQALPDWGNRIESPPGDLSEKLLRLVTEGTRETEELIRSFWDSPTKWCNSRALENSGERLDGLLRSLDYYRWQVVKEFAKLMTIFDDHDDPDFDEPCEAWDRDLEAIIADDIRNV
jgi:hypothetical protein